MGISPDHNRAPHAAHRVVAWDNVSCNEVGAIQPRQANEASDDVVGSALETVCASLGPCNAGRLTDGSSSPAVPAFGSAAAGCLACFCLAERPATEQGLRHFPVPRLAAASQSPTQVPVDADSLSAIEAPRVGPLTAHDDVTEKICVMPLSLGDRGRTAGSVFSSWHRGIPHKLTADADAVTARSLPQECVNAWRVECLTAVRRPYGRDVQEEKEGTQTA
ncbi:hypothetical protein MOQ_008285 [Trypanosoma cruzi marinkellei]|uniref:Uncharacterized protein n=1 Tax=Trypanosoma cruzi marinkellei TaxID=85056 RepID=K2N041_TRYCR|nr:hypothetical protein MOQ_008285 [Trypanosoma cruzi marinkellei]